MMAEELLEELRRCDVQVEACGKVFQVEAPRGALSPELLRSLRRLKPALLQLVAPTAAQTVSETLGGVSESGPSQLMAEVCAMRLEDVLLSRGDLRGNSCDVLCRCRSYQLCTRKGCRQTRA